jgi:hypothetical protein
MNILKLKSLLFKFKKHKSLFIENQADKMAEDIRVHEKTVLRFIFNFI